MNVPISRYPLQWPAGWPRTPDYRRGYAKFSRKRSNGFGNDSLSVADGLGRVIDELTRMNVREGDLVISTNLQTRLDGLPRSDQANPSDPGVAVYWVKKGETKVIAIDHYNRVADNLAAIAATLDAMRAIERHGGAQILERAFVGFAALSAPASAKPWWDVLGFDARPTKLELVKERYRSRASMYHPDKGGTTEQMAEINRAWEEAQRELGA